MKKIKFKRMLGIDMNIITRFIKENSGKSHNESIQLLMEDIDNQDHTQIEEVDEHRISIVYLSKLNDGWIKSFALTHDIESSFYLLFTD